MPTTPTRSRQGRTDSQPQLAALLGHQQQRYDAERDVERAPPVDPPGAAGVRDVEHLGDDEEGDDADRHVHQEHPAPADDAQDAVLTGEEAADERPSDAGGGEGGEHVALVAGPFAGRHDVADDREGEGHQAAGAEHVAEAERRWGDTDAYRESQRRASSYGKQDWLDIKREGEQVNAAFVAALDAGLPPDSPEAAAAATAHRNHISSRFYELTDEMHQGLARMYVGDDRFMRNYDDQRPGLAQYVCDAVLALYR